MERDRRLVLENRIIVGTDDSHPELPRPGYHDVQVPRKGTTGQSTSRTVAPAAAHRPRRAEEGRSG